MELPTFFLLLSEGKTASETRDFFHLFSTGTLGAGGKAEIGKCATHCGCLGVLEARDSIYVAVALSLRCPACRRGKCVIRAAIDECFESDLAVFACDQFCIDAALRKARIKQLDTFGYCSVLIGAEDGVCFGHRVAGYNAGCLKL